MDGVGTDTHLHTTHALSVLVAIIVEREVSTGMGLCNVRAANLRCGLVLLAVRCQSARWHAVVGFSRVTVRTCERVGWGGPAVTERL